MALVKYNNNSISTISSAGQLASGSLVPIKTLTASSSSTLSFVDGSSDVVLDSTYPIYLFKFINIHQATDQAYFQFNFSIDSGSNYNVTKTTTMFNAFHREDDDTPELVYVSSADLSQSTNFANLSILTGNGNDESQSGTLMIFNPSSTTFVKHFVSDLQCHYRTGLPASVNYKGAGYGNTTSAVDGVQFKFSSGNIDAGQIKLYGIKDS